MDLVIASTDNLLIAVCGATHHDVALIYTGIGRIGSGVVGLTDKVGGIGYIGEIAVNLQTDYLIGSTGAQGLECPAMGFPAHGGGMTYHGYLTGIPEHLVASYGSEMELEGTGIP